MSAITPTEIIAEELVFPDSYFTSPTEVSKAEDDSLKGDLYLGYNPQTNDKMIRLSGPAEKGLAVAVLPSTAYRQYGENANTISSGLSFPTLNLDFTKTTLCPPPRTEEIPRSEFYPDITWTHHLKGVVTYATLKSIEKTAHLAAAANCKDVMMVEVDDDDPGPVGADNAELSKN